jgi:hypothetical protein
VNRSSINWRMVPVLVGALLIALVAMPGEVGATLREFFGVAGDAARGVHDGYMRLFHG